MADNNGDIGAFMSGFIIGGLVGAAVALVMAPQSGEDTRTLIRDRGLELRDRADGEVKQIRSRAEQTIAELRTQADDVQKKSLEMIEETRQKVAEAIEQGIEAAKKTRDDLSSGARKSESKS